MTTETQTMKAPTGVLYAGPRSAERDRHLEALKAAGFPVHSVETTDEATACLTAEPFGLVVMDVPALDLVVLETCRHFKQIAPGIFLLLLAAPAKSETPGAFDGIADGILFEPIVPLELVTSVRTLLRLAQSQNGTAPFQEPSGQLASFFDASIDAIISIDETDAITAWSSASEKMFGYATAEMLGAKLPDIHGSADVLSQRHQYLQHLHEGEPIEFQAVRPRKDGEPIEIWVRGAPMKAPDGHVTGATFFIRDITAQKRREQHVHFLMRELTHRSKNLLAVIQAMARQSLGPSISPEDFVTRFSARLSGLAGSHDLLSSVDWEGASLVDLIRSQLRHYEDRFDEKIQIDGPDLFLKPEAAQNIGIALHELSTNAVKYGALSTPAGKVSIFWTVKTENDISRLHMTWQETGGPSVTAPSHKGFGHVVMDRITGQALGGVSHAEFHPDGVTWILDVPTASVVLERDKPASF